MEPYEQYTRRGGDAALREIDSFFAGSGRVHQTLRRIVAALTDLNVRYAVTGAMALNAHGYRRATIDVDVAVANDDVAFVIDQLVEIAYDRVVEKPKSIRDRATAVRIDLRLRTDLVSVSIDGIQYQSLPQLIESKLVVGLTQPAQMKHLGDVVETIKALILPLDFRTQLREDLQPKFEEYWQAVQTCRDEY